MKRIHQLVAGIVAVAIALVVLELVLRGLGFTPRPTMNRFDSRLGWTKTPSASSRRHTSEFDVTVETNSRGLREDEAAGYEKPANATRILLVGDSFTLGYTTAKGDTLSQLLQARLRGEGRSVQVLNGGTEGYSTDQEVLWLGVEGARYRPDIVILQMYENDIFWNGESRYLRYPKPRIPSEDKAPLEDLRQLPDPGLEPWMVRRTALGSLLGNLFAAPALPMLPGPRPIPAEWGVLLRDDASGWADTRTALRQFRALAGYMEARPLVLAIPSKAQLDPAARSAMTETLGGDPAYDPDRPYRGMIDAARAAGLPVIGAKDALEKAAERSPDEPLYFARDWHTTPFGNRVIADDVAQALATPELLGPAPHAAAAAVSSSPEPARSRAADAARALALLAGVWLALGTLYWRRFPTAGPIESYGAVAALVAFVAGVFWGIGWLVALLPHWLGRWASSLAILGLLGVALWYLGRRLVVMGELFASFVRRGQWYLLPVVVVLLSVGALLVVAATSPWLAPFIYTLF